MRITESCARCLYDKQKNLTDNKEYLDKIKKIIDTRKEDDTSPFLVYLFTQEYIKYFGKKDSYKDIKKQYNDLVLGIEDKIRQNIIASENPILMSLLYARAGNYIDFGAMNHVDKNVFLSLLNQEKQNDTDTKTLESFLTQCSKAKNFLLITDNCGEIVLDKLFIEQIKIRFPKLNINVLVRGNEVLNDATMKDAEYVGLNNIANIISNGTSVAGTIYNMISDTAKEVIDKADVILAKGQGNYESLSGQGRHIFYSFLCKCDLFTSRFNVPKLTGMFIEEI